MPSTVVRIYMYLTYLIPEETLCGRYSYSPGGEMGNCSGDGLSNQPLSRVASAPFKLFIEEA